MTAGLLDHPMTAADLIAELSERATHVGANTGVWPGLTIYRFTSPVGPTWEEIQSLSLCIVAQGRKAVTVEGGETYLYDPFHYLVLSSHLHFQAEILEATQAKPFLSFVLQIDPTMVRQVSSDILERRTTTFRRRDTESGEPDKQAFVSALDQELLGAVQKIWRCRVDGRLRDVHKRLAAVFAASKRSTTEIPGVGPSSRAMVVGFTGNVKRFAALGLVGGRLRCRARDPQWLEWPHRAVIRSIPRGPVVNAPWNLIANRSKRFRCVPDN